MKAAARLLVAFPAAALLGWAAFEALASGAADQAVYGADERLRAVTLDGAKPTAEALEGLARELDAALAQAPLNPTAHELLARIAELQTTRADCFLRAEREYRSAIAQRPSSPYAWAGLARAKYLQGDPGEEFQAALVRAGELGPEEPEVQRVIEDLGLATWDDSGPAARDAVVAALRRGLRRDPTTTLQIAGRRGRLAVACEQRDAAPPKSRVSWEGLCKAREARS